MHAVCTLLFAGLVGAAPFSIGIELPTHVPYSAALESALRDIGIDYVNYYVKPWAATPEERAIEVNAATLDFAERLGVDYSLACYLVDPPEACVAAAVERSATAASHDQKGRFQGVVFDELAHARLLHQEMHEGGDRLADPTTFTSLADAYEQTLAGFTALREKHDALGAASVATHVFPALLHVAARAGFTPCPKIQKELFSPVSLAIGLGAALQYDRALWVDVDLWFWDLVPGHTPEEVESNLKLAYWLGADRVYLEGCGHNLTEAGNQGVPFSIVSVINDTRYQLTAHGEMLKRFCREYLPAHPRPWTFRDIRPEVAIIRFPDGDWGQRYAHWFPNRLYGSDNLPTTADTSAWLGLWNILTHGKTGRDGFTYFKVWCATYGFGPAFTDQIAYSLHTRPFQAELHPFFAPLKGVVVFDHLVTYDRLKGIPLLCVTGDSLSPETFEAVVRCAREGATVLIWGPLAERCGLAWNGELQPFPEGEGKIVRVDDFGGFGTYGYLQPHLGRPDEISYRFGDQEVILRKVTDNIVDVELPE